MLFPMKKYALFRTNVGHMAYSMQLRNRGLKDCNQRFVLVLLPLYLHNSIRKTSIRCRIYWILASDVTKRR